MDFPATMVVVGGFDVLLDWQKRYYEWLKKSGKEAYLVEYPNMYHSFYPFPEFPESEQLMSEFKDFIHKVTSSKKVANII
ncbi:putative carboxylesterase [Helianthus anomalus]